MRARLFFAGLFLLAGCGASAAAECNKPFLMIDSLKLSPAGKDDPRFTVPATVNGQNAEFLFDTGGALPALSEELADGLKVSRHNADVQLYGVAGHRSDQFTVVDFNMGRIVHASKAEIMISTPNIITPVFMGQFDFDFDSANGKLNVFSGDHCPGKVIYWPYKVATAVSYTKLDNHIMVPVTVDGKDFKAIIDTGADTSTMRLDLATYTFGLKPDTPGMKAIGHMRDDEKAVVYHYPFKTLTFGDITVSNPKIVILPDIVGKNADQDWGWFGGHITAPPDDLKLPQIIIGMDVLSKLHIYFAQGERKLYITEATHAAPSP